MKHPKATLTTILLAFALWFTSPAQTRADSLYLELQRQGVPYALEWMQVARTEAGYNLDSYMAKHHHNYLGIGLTPEREYTVQGWQRPDGSLEPPKSGFSSIAACVRALKARIYRCPYRMLESPYAYLVRTGWNPKGWAYADYVRRVSVADLIK